MIRTRGLTKTYGSVRAVDAVDLDVREGDVYGFLGANGSGKTTTVRMLLGLVLANAGEAEIFGEPMPRSGASVLPRIGALVEGPGAYPHLSGARQPRASSTPQPGRGRTGRRGDARIGEVLEQVGLDPADRRPTKTYSLGHAAAARTGGSVDAPPSPAGARRADQRTRPPGHPRHPRAAARP